MTDRKTQSAVLRQLEIIGAAVKNLRADLTVTESAVPWRQIARHAVHHTQRSQRLTTGPKQGRAGIEADARFAGHHRVVGKARIERGVGHHHHRERIEQRVGAIRMAPGYLGERKPVLGLGPSAVVVHPVDQRHRRVADGGGKLRQVVVRQLGRRVERIVQAQRRQPRGLVG